MPRLLRYSPEANDDRMAGENSLPLAVLEFGSPSEAIIAAPIPASSRAINLFVFLLVVSVLVASGLITTDKIVEPAESWLPRHPISRCSRLTRPSSRVSKSEKAISSAKVGSRSPEIRLSLRQITRQSRTRWICSAPRSRDFLALTSGSVYVIDPANSHAALQGAILQQQTNEYNLTLEGYDRKIDELKSQIDGDLAQVGYFQKRLEVANDIEGMRAKLQERELGSRLNTLLAADARLNISGSLSASESDAAQASRRMAAEQAGRQTFIEQWNCQNSQELANSRGKLVQSQQDYAKANLHNQLVVLTAPRDAIVLSVANVSVGSVVTSAEPLILLVPIDAPLSVEADISGIESGYISPGDEVTIKFRHASLPSIWERPWRGARDQRR